MADIIMRICACVCLLSILDVYGAVSSVEPGKNACGVATGSEPPGQPPWLAILYHRQSGADEWEQWCMGTLITPHIVITSAHCVVNSETALNVDTITVGLETHDRNSYKLANNSKPLAVREIVIPRKYIGRSSNYANDVALLDLAENVPVTASVMPACVDWENKITNQPGTVGQVAGWDYSENRTLTMTAAVSDYVSCTKKFKKGSFITDDKFCAESTGGKELGKRSSGAGLTIVHNGLHYVFGVLSTKFRETEEKPSIFAFTDLQDRDHYEWLKDRTKYLDTKH